MIIILTLLAAGIVLSVSTGELWFMVNALMVVVLIQHVYLTKVFSMLENLEKYRDEILKGAGEMKKGAVELKKDLKNLHSSLEDVFKEVVEGLIELRNEGDEDDSDRW